MKTFLLLLFSMTAPLLADSSAAYPPDPHETEGGRRAPTFSAANASAIHWLTLVDQRAYSGSWLESGSLFKDVITQHQWTAAMHAIRTPLGTVSARKVGSHSMVNSLRYGTRGNFIVIKYQTQFSRHGGVTETVTLMSDEVPTRVLATDPETSVTELREGVVGQWKVISYSIDGR